MFKARTMRTLLTILGMGVGMAAILFLVALGFGVQEEMLNVITTQDSLLSLDVYPVKTDQMIGQETISEIKSIEGVDIVSPVYLTKLQAKYEGISSNTQGQMVDKYFLNLNGTKIIRGRGISDEITRGVVISSTFAKLFNKNPGDMINGDLSFSSVAFSENNQQKPKYLDMEKNYQIIGVMESKENMLFINKASLEGIINISNYSQLKIKCKTQNDVENVKNKIGSMGFFVSSVSDTVKETNKFFAIIRLILGLFGMIALIVSSIGMFNTMTVALLERTEEIGIMKAIGAYDRDILAMFVFESTMMGFLGGICGIITGFLGAKTFNLLLNLVAKRMGGNSVNLFSFPLWFLAFILVSSTIVGFLTGIIPAKKASSTDPLDALRYK
jgi:putative ABC transport system permease protein